MPPPPSPFEASVLMKLDEIVAILKCVECHVHYLHVAATRDRLCPSDPDVDPPQPE